ncbi:MAG: Sec-independent protein translocase protein TatB [Brachymonas sp.]|nr:Sec-independent protein translocase protein TatB [Brachymonas sp.]MDO4794359.1 Sec-independent protein translocase protein TatB [Brachymonas sp.]
MIDLGISQLTVIGIVALIVVGPEKLPAVARTLGTLIGRAQRYINDIKSEVGHVAGLNELRQMKQTVEQTAWDLQQQVNDVSHQVQRDWSSLGSMKPLSAYADDIEDVEAHSDLSHYRRPTGSHYAPRKNWRIKRSALPHWYKARQRVRTRVLSGAARVARYRPPQAPSH